MKFSLTVLSYTKYKIVILCAIELRLCVLLSRLQKDQIIGQNKHIDNKNVLIMIMKNDKSLFEILS